MLFCFFISERSYRLNIAVLFPGFASLGWFYVDYNVYCALLMCFVAACCENVLPCLANIPLLNTQYTYYTSRVDTNPHMHRPIYGYIIHRHRIQTKTNIQYRPTASYSQCHALWLVWKGRAASTLNLYWDWNKTTVHRDAINAARLHLDTAVLRAEC